VDTEHSHQAPGRSPGREIIRGQAAGLLAGASVGAALAVAASTDPMWHVSTIPVLVFGGFVGGLLGVLAGFVAGVTLRFMRGSPVTLAVPAAGVAATAAVTVALYLLGWGARTNPSAFPVAGGVVAGVGAALATPWIRRGPADAPK
jgi:hypothetical protein